MSHHDPESKEAPTAESPSRSHVLLLMGPTGDRSVLAEWLGRQHEVSLGADTSALDQEFDCCLVDETMFARHHTALAERKRRAQPTFLPYLLVASGQGDRPDDPQLWEYVDELLRTPIRKAELQSRLVGLLSRRDLSKALAEQQERYRRILRTIPDPVFVLDASGVVAECNPAFEEDLSHDRQPVTGRSLDSLDAFPGAAIETLSALAEDVRDRTSNDPPGDDPTDASGPGAASVTYRAADGRERTAEVAVAPLRTTPDGTQGALFVFRDVTERIDREQALEHERERLSDFASMLAHEVRNPLNVAQGYLEEVTPDSETERKAIDRVIAAQARMEQMIKELLAHARGGTVESVQSVTLREISETAWGATQTGEASLELDVGDGTIEADPENLRTVLENLFRNAVDHAGPEVTVRVGRLESGGFYVEDDGPGIPPEDREAVFERGFTTSAAGSGLGLTLVRQMAEAHDWEVRATEGESGGARFEFAIDEPDSAGDRAPDGEDR